MVRVFAPCALVVAALATAPARADEGLPWVALAGVTDTARSGLEARVTAMLSQSLLAAEVNLVAAEDFAAAAQGVPRARWSEPGALAGAAAAAGADFLVFATIDRVGTVYALRLTAVRPRAGPEVVAREEVAFAQSPPAAELDAALRRLVAALARANASSDAPAPPPPDDTANATSGGGAPTDAAKPDATTPAAATVDDGGGDGWLLVGGAASSVAAAGALTLGVVFAVNAWSASEALVTLPKGSEDRTARELAALDQAIVADVGFGSALALAAVGTTLFVMAATSEEAPASTSSMDPASTSGVGPASTEASASPATSNATAQR